MPTGVECHRHRVVEMNRVGIWSLDVSTRERWTHHLPGTRPDELLTRDVRECLDQIRRLDVRVGCDSTGEVAPDFRGVGAHALERTPVCICTDTYSLRLVPRLCLLTFAL
jgi:hypothetical protein